MADLRNFWFHPQSPQSYHQVMNDVPSGIIDEKIIANFINNYLPRKKKIIVDLGIGSGREMVWLDKVSGVEKVIGIDYSPAMLQFCQKEAKNYKHKIELLKDDLLKLLRLPKVAEKEKKPAVYISLINTFGNFSSEERVTALKNISKILKSADRIILALYHRCHHARFLDLIRNLYYFQTQNPKDQPILAELIEYGFYPFLWIPVLDKYHQMPRLWYDQKGNDVVIHLDGKRLLTSHRFSKEEIEEEFRQAGLKITKLIEGKAMWIVVGRI